MAQDDLLKRYLDAGMAFTAMTQQRAEAIVKDLVKAGEMQAEQAQAAAQDLLDRSRKNTEKLLGQIRREVRDQITNLGLATKTDIDRLDRKISSASTSGRSSSSTAKKSTARKSTAKKATAKKSTAKKSTAKKSTAKKSTAKKSTAKKSTAKKSTAKKSSGRSNS